MSDPSGSSPPPRVSSPPDRERLARALCEFDADKREFTGDFALDWIEKQWPLFEDAADHLLALGYTLAPRAAVPDELWKNLDPDKFDQALAAYNGFVVLGETAQLNALRHAIATYLAAPSPPTQERLTPEELDEQRHEEEAND